MAVAGSVLARRGSGDSSVGLGEAAAKLERNVFRLILSSQPASCLPGFLFVATAATDRVPLEIPLVIRRAFFDFRLGLRSIYRSFQFTFLSASPTNLCNTVTLLTDASTLCPIFFRVHILVAHI
jgi:hypothetical protein